ncbi:hypothetical protein ACFSKL_13420 [Belliella marina]|uniref:Lipoprotein n=1 Tax=Belliella marina TaxID=1644146 RepID=A0ABW4VNP3_9BACT
MKNTLLSKLIFFFSIVSLTISCVEKFDDDATNPVNGIDWVNIADIGTSVYNHSYVDNNLNLISGDKLFYHFEIKGQNNNSFNFEEYQTRPGWFKLPITKDFLVTRTELDVNVFAINTNAISAPISIKPIDLDPTFVRFEDMPFWSGFDAFGLTENGHVLIPYRTSINGLAENNPSFLLISLKKESTNIIVSEIKVVKPSVINYYDSVSIVFANGNFFYVKVGNNLLKIDHQGNVKVETKIDGIKFSKLDNKIIGIGYANSTKETTIFEASLNGSNFKAISKSSSNDNPTLFNYTGINNRVVGFLDDKIYELVDLASNPKLRELNNSKLESTLISSIFLSNNGEVTVTTQCRTLCGGIYSKPLDKLFDYK